MAKLFQQKGGKVGQGQNGSKSKQLQRCSDITDDHNSSKPISQQILCSTLYSVCGTLTLLMFAYLFKKCFDILKLSWTDQEEGVCYFGLFSCTTESTRQLTITDREFYFRLFDSVFDDLLITHQFINTFIKNFLNSIDVDTSMAISFFSLTFSVLCVILWFLYYWKLEKRRKKQISNFNHSSIEDSSCSSYMPGSIVGMKSRRSLWRWLPRLTFLAFLISVPWEFVRLYQFKVAEKITHITKGIPDECVLQNMTYIQYLKSWMRWQFSWSSDVCFQYHTALHVDPVWQVTPLLVLTSMVSNCIVHPLENLCGGLGRAFRLFFSEIPSQWQPVMLAVILIILLMVIVMLFGYKVRFPFIKIEPKTPTNVKVKCCVRKQPETKALEGYSELDSSQEVSFVK